MKLPSIPPHAGTIDHADQPELVERAYLMMAEYSRYINKGQMKNLALTLPKGTEPK